MSKVTVKWDLLHLKCGNCGNDLKITDGQWGCFYSCSSYPKCFNRVNSGIYEKILEKVTELLSADPDTNFTGYRWKYRTGYQNIQFKIAKHQPDKFIVEVTNVKERKAI